MRSRKNALRGTALVVVTVGCVIGLLAGTALAAVTTIGALKAAPVADQEVTLTGTITGVTEGNEYVLDDGTGTISIDCGPAWYAGIGLAMGATATVTGEVDLGRPGGTPTVPEVDVQTIGNGGVITEVRPVEGPPPWAGGPHKNGQHPGQGVPDDDDEVAGQPDAD